MEQLSQIHLQFTLGQQADAREARLQQMASALKGLESWVTLGEQQPTLENVDHCYRWLREIERFAPQDQAFLRIARRLYEAGTLLPAMNRALESVGNRRLVKLWDYYNDCEAERVGPRQTYQAVPPYDFWNAIHDGFTVDERVLKEFDQAVARIQFLATANGVSLCGVGPTLRFELWDRSFKWLKSTKFVDIYFPNALRISHLPRIFKCSKKARRVVVAALVQDPHDLYRLNEVIEKEAGSKYRMATGYSLNDYPMEVELQQLNQRPLKLWSICIR